MSTTTSSVVRQSEAFSVMRRIFDEGFATGNAEIVDELCSPHLVEHQFGLAGSGAEAIEHVKDAIRDVHRMAPDMAFTIDDAVQDGDTIWVRVTGRGTATGPFFGPPRDGASKSPWWISPEWSTAASWNIGAYRIGSHCWLRPAC